MGKQSQLITKTWLERETPRRMMRAANNRAPPGHEPNAVLLGLNMIGKIFTRYSLPGRKSDLPNFAKNEQSILQRKKIDVVTTNITM
jgi:hypothetical protein